MHALKVEKVSKRYGGIHALRNVSFTLKSGGVHALIGPNGAGKTTLVSVIAGEVFPDSGRILLKDRDISRDSVHQRSRLGLGRTYQVTSLFPDLTVRRNLELALLGQSHPGIAASQFLRRYRSAAFEDETQRIVEEFGLAARASALPSTLSHGDRRRLELAMAICTRPDVLLLDEPLAGLSHADADALVTLVAGRLRGQIPILLIEHDMDAVFDLADDITVLVNGTVLKVGSPEEIRTSPEVKAAYLSEDDDF